MPEVTILIGRTASGFNRWLKERNLTKIEAEKLAELVLETIDAYEKRDENQIKLILLELYRLTGARDILICIELARQFARLCDTTKTVIEFLKEENKVEERLKEYEQRQERYWHITEKMLGYGGSFVKQLAILWRKADPINKARLEECFSDYFEEYEKKP